METRTNFPIGEIIAQACDTPQVIINYNLFIGDLSLAGLLIVVLAAICLILVFRAIVGKGRKRRD